MSVSIGEIPDDPNTPDYVGTAWRLVGRRFYLEVPGVVRLMVHDGREIVAQPLSAVTETDIAPFILSTGFAAILHQRRLLALHAATVAWKGQAITLCGPTGAGKSTLSAALCQAGADFVGDDIAAIRTDGPDGTPVVWPDGRQHRLWADAIEHLTLAERQGAPIRSHMRKFHVAPSSPVERAGDACPLAAVILLRTRENTLPPGPPGIERLALADAASLLRREVYRPSLARCMGHDPLLFLQIAALLDRVPVFRLERTRGLEHLDASATLVLDAMTRAG
ncbi:hypothetical protein [Radicibacter daui]|uniref:hypothetical protein n=1 Tax=Radicibacter daui TaxID=3064829 RepID=UPI0040469FB8